MRCYIATHNQKKIELTRIVLSEVFPNIEVIGCNAVSGVSETPWDSETYFGAKNRANNSLKSNSDADLGVGIETGLTKKFGKIFEETWCCLVSKTDDEFFGYASSNVINNDVATKVIVKKDGTKRLEGYEGDRETREDSLLASLKISAILLKKSNRF